MTHRYNFLHPPLPPPVIGVCRTFCPLSVTLLYYHTIRPSLAPSLSSLSPSLFFFTPKVLCFGATAVFLFGWILLLFFFLSKREYLIVLDEDNSKLKLPNLIYPLQCIGFLFLCNYSKANSLKYHYFLAYNSVAVSPVLHDWIFFSGSA